jgi:hypothetical protein
MTETPETSSTFKRLQAGAVRGAKFGAIAGLIIGLVTALGSTALTLLNPTIRQEEFGSGRNVFSVVGSSAVAVGLVAIYGAIIGAIVMALAAARRR